MFDKNRLKVYAITDALDAGLPGRVEAAVRGGVTVVQLRLKGASARAVFEAGEAVLAVCRRGGVPLVVNDRVDLALALGADGVHLGPEDLPVAAVRAFVPAGFTVGGSAGSVEAALALERAGADYLGVGAIFEARPSKANASAPRGVALLASVCEATSIPVVAIGGVGVENARSCMDAGAAGVAVIRAVFGEGDVEAVARRARRLRGIVEGRVEV